MGDYTTTLYSPYILGPLENQWYTCFGRTRSIHFYVFRRPPPFWNRPDSRHKVKELQVDEHRGGTRWPKVKKNKDESAIKQPPNIQLTLGKMMFSSYSCMHPCSHTKHGLWLVIRNSRSHDTFSPKYNPDLFQTTLNSFLKHRRVCNWVFLESLMVQGFPSTVETPDVTYWPER